MLLHDLFPRRVKFPVCSLSLRVVSDSARSVPYKLSTYAMNLPLHYKYFKSDAYAFFWSFAVTRVYIGFCHRLSIIFPFPASETHDPQFSFMYVLLQFPHNHTGNFNSHLMRPSTNTSRWTQTALLILLFQKCQGCISDHWQDAFLITNRNIQAANSISRKALPFVLVYVCHFIPPIPK